MTGQGRGLGALASLIPQRGMFLLLFQRKSKPPSSFNGVQDPEEDTLVTWEWPPVSPTPAHVRSCAGHQVAKTGHLAWLGPSPRPPPEDLLAAPTQGQR